VADKNENISVDEMMQNLKRGSNKEIKQSADPATDLKDGTLVTRADGSKAVKVRSRKRRSHQPKKEKEKKKTRNKVILICSGIFLLLIAGIAFVVTLAHYNGSKFSEKLVTTIESRSGAEVEMRGANVSVGSTEMMQLSFDWKSPNSVVDYLKIDGVRAEYGVFSFFGGGWSGPEVLADSGEIRLNLLENPEQISVGEDEPVEFDFSTYKCNNLNAIIGKDENWLVKDTQASFSVNAKGEKQVYFYGGVLKAPFFEEHTIKSGVVGIKPTVADLSLVLQPKKGDGTVSLEGEVGYKDASSISLATKFTEVNMKDWVDIKTQRFIYGDITSGEGVFKMKLGEFESKEILTHVKSNKVVISKFSFLETLALEMNNDFFSRRPSFESGSSFSMNWTKDKVVFSNIKLVESLRMQLKGDFEVLRTGEISGKFKIGVPIISLSPAEIAKLKKVFKEDDGDFMWTDVTIGGSIATPTDDLAQQFESAKVKSPEAAFDLINEGLSE